jgi:hypothetical protein
MAMCNYRRSLNTFFGSPCSLPCYIAISPQKLPYSQIVTDLPPISNSKYRDRSEVPGFLVSIASFEFFWESCRILFAKSDYSYDRANIPADTSERKK